MRKSKYDQLADAVSQRIHEMRPENCASIEEAVRNAETLSQAFGIAPTTAEDYSHCGKCGAICYHGVCRNC